MSNRLTLAAACAFAALLSSGAAFAEVKSDYLGFEQKELLPFQPGDAAGAPSGSVVFGSPANGPLPHAVIRFEGISQYDVASVARNFIPPDTIAAAGRTQIMEFANGGVAVFDKATGMRTSFSSDLAFWQGLGQAGANGDSRVMYNAEANRWIATSFANNVSQIQIAVSDTSNASGDWKSTVFTGYAGLGFGGTADYPTLALTQNSVIIGTNDFAPATAGGANAFRGTGLTIIPLDSLFNAGGPTVANGVQFFTGCCGAGSDFTRGYAIQGVNGSGAGGVDSILAVSIEANGLTTYDISALNRSSALGAQRGAATDFLGLQDYTVNGSGRQPYTTGTGDPRVIDTLDDRVGSSVYEVNGRIYSLHTITEVDSLGQSLDHTYVRWDVMDAATRAILAEGDIGDGIHDYYEGSLAVNSRGQVVMAYNRSGTDPLDGNISIFARQFMTLGDGSLSSIGGEVLLKVSDSDSYHNGSRYGLPAAGRQRWGDYSSVSLDPEDESMFWIAGEFAREPNDEAHGHPGGTGGTRWGTYITGFQVGNAVPEPGTWMLLISGFGLAGAALRRRRMIAA